MENSREIFRKLRQCTQICKGQNERLGEADPTVALRNSNSSWNKSSTYYEHFRKSGSFEI
jgi:hypothetical protein